MILNPYIIFQVLKFGALPLVIVGGVIWIMAHLNEHENLKEKNVDLANALEASRIVAGELRHEINKRDQIIKDRDLAYRQISRRLNVDKRKVTESTDQAVSSWRDSRLPLIVVNGLREISAGGDEDRADQAATSVD